MKIHVLFTFALSTFLQLFEKYVFDDWEFLRYMFVLCAVDAIFLMMRTIRLKQLSRKTGNEFFLKILVYCGCLIATHALVTFTVANNKVYVFSWLNTFMFSAIMVREAICIFESVAVLDPSFISVRVLRYLKAFDDAGHMKTPTPQ